VFSYLLWGTRKGDYRISCMRRNIVASEHLTDPRASLAVGGKADTMLPFAPVF